MLKVLYSLLACIIFPVYWYQYGASNFLWFSDIAFFLMVPALWFKNRLIASMMAVGVLPLEILWVIGLLTGGSFLGMAAYMFDSHLPLWLRALSFFHFPMMASILYMIRRFGYDPRALYPQIVLTLSVIILTHLFTNRVDNVNLIYPPKEFENIVSQSVYFLVMPCALLIGIILPMHLYLKSRFFPREPAQLFFRNQ